MKDKKDKITEIKSKEDEITDKMLEDDINRCIVYFFDKKMCHLYWFINQILKRPLKGNSVPLVERAIDAAFKKLSARVKYNLYLKDDGYSDLEFDVLSEGDDGYISSDFNDESDDPEDVEIVQLNDKRF